MLIFFGIVLVIACVLLGFFVLIQNPKGGGLSGSFGGFGNQVIGVRQTTDVLEKGTWILAAIIGVLCLTSKIFIGTGAIANQEKTILEQNARQQQSAPAPTPVQPQGTPLPNTK